MLNRCVALRCVKHDLRSSKRSKKKQSWRSQHIVSLMQHHTCIYIHAAMHRSLARPPMPVGGVRDMQPSCMAAWLGS